MSKKKVILVAAGIATGLVSLIYEVRREKKMDSLEKAVSGLILTQESILSHQAMKNEDFEERIEQLVDEIACVYEHMAVLSE